jgi:hypothetical protein
VSGASHWPAELLELKYHTFLIANLTALRLQTAELPT